MPQWATVANSVSEQAVAVVLLLRILARCLHQKRAATECALTIPLTDCATAS
jgi:hypothetical protein